MQIQDVITAIELYEKRVITLEDLGGIAANYFFLAYKIKFIGWSFEEPGGEQGGQGVIS